MQKLEKGTYLDAPLITSKAYLSLTGCSPQILTIFLAKRHFIEKNKRHSSKKEFKPIHNEILRFSYVEAQTYGISGKRFARAISQLLARGFLKIEHQGGAYRQDQSGYIAIDDWRYWEKGEVIRKRVKTTIQKGFINNSRGRKRTHTHGQKGPCRVMGAKMAV